LPADDDAIGKCQ